MHLRGRWNWVSLGLTLVLAALAVEPSPAQGQTVPRRPQPGASAPAPGAAGSPTASPTAPPAATAFVGEYFPETGFSVSDADGVLFLSEFRRLGGVQAVGYPASKRFQWDGFTVQVFQ